MYLLTTQCVAYYLVLKGIPFLFDQTWHDSHLKLLPTSILDINKVFEYIDMLSMGIQ